MRVLPAPSHRPAHGLWVAGGLRNALDTTIGQLPATPIHEEMCLPTRLGS